MRLTTGLLAEVKGPSGVKFLNVGAPTGLTGIHTHRSPRPHLLYLYHQTLQKLASLPEISVYRQSTEALTRHRLKAVEAAIPEGVDAWRSRVTKHLDEHAGRTKRLVEQMLTGKGYPPQAIRTADDRDVEWNDDVGEERAEGPRNLEAQGKNQARDFGVGMEVEEQTKQHPQVEDEPPLSADQYVVDLGHWNRWRETGC